MNERKQPSRRGKFRMITVHVRPSIERRNGKTFRRKPYSYKKKSLSFGGGFDSLVDKVVKENKGKINPKTGKKYTRAELIEYGKDVAADVYRRKRAKYLGEKQ